MQARQQLLGGATRRLTSAARSPLFRTRQLPRISSSNTLSTHQPSPIASSLRLLPSLGLRLYSNGGGGRGGRPHPPGGTHRMNMGGGEEEKPALEEYGTDLTAKARDGKLDPV